MATGNVKRGFVKLWENPAPTSSFSAQLIPIDLSTYDSVLVRFTSGTAAGGVAASVSAPIDGGNYQAFVITNLTSTGAMQIGARYFDALTTGINFEGATVKATNTTSSGTANNARIIPIAIYGIRY